MPSLGSLVATIRLDIGDAVAQINTFGTAVERAFTQAFASVRSQDLGGAQMAQIEAAAAQSAVQVAKVAAESAASAAALATTASNASNAAAAMEKMSGAARKVATDVQGVTGPIASWDDYLKAAAAEQARLTELASEYASLTNRALQAQKELNRLTSFRGDTLAPRSISLQTNLAQRSSETGRFMDSIDTATRKIRESWSDFDRVVQLVNGDLQTTGTIAQQLEARFRAADIAALGVRVHAQGLAGHLRVSVAPLERVAARARELGHNLNASSVSAGRLTNSLQQAANAAQQVGRAGSGADFQKFGREMLNLGAILAPGRAGTALFAVGGLTRAFAALGPAAAGGGAAIGGVAAAAVIALPAIIALTAGTVGFVAIVKTLAVEGVEGAKSIETLTVSFAALLGSTEAAKGEIRSLIDVARESPFKLDTLLDLDRMLLSQGVQNQLVRGNLVKSINQLASAFGLTDDNVRNLGRAVAQVFGRGYLSGDELRQLYNQMVPIWDLLRALPEFAGKSQAELRKLSETGKISALDMARAWDAFAIHLQGAAEAQANTLVGLIQRWEDLKTAVLGLAFQDVVEEGVGPLEAIENVIRPIIELLESIDFRPLAHSIGLLFQGLLQPISQVSGDLGWLQKLFQEWLPKAIAFVGIVIDEFIKGIHGIGAAFEGIWLVIKQVLPILVVAFGIWFVEVIAGINYMIGAFTVFINVIAVVIGLIRSVIAFFTGGDARGAIEDTFEGVRGIIEGIKNQILAVPRAINTVITAAERIRSLDDQFADITSTEPGGTPSPGPEAMEEITEAAKKAKKGVDEVAKAMNDLWELTRRFFGQRSELEKGLLGDEGFTATVDSIVGMGKRLLEIFKTIGAPATAALISKSIFALIRLAEKREEVAERLKNAQEALADAISARDEFARSIEENTRAFANALSVEETTEQRWRHIAEQGFFIVEERKKQESFVEALRKRVAAIKDFFRNIKALAAAGLDRGLLEQLFAAGPEQGGGIAAGILAGGAAGIAEINALQDQVDTLSEAMADYGAEKFYQAGVDQAQAVVTGIQSQLDQIEDMATEIGNLVYDTVLPFAKKMEDTGADMGNGVASGIDSSLGNIGDSMSDLDDEISQPWENLNKRFGETAENTHIEVIDEFEGLLGNIKDWSTDFEGEVTGIATTIQGALDKIEVDVLEWLPSAELARAKILLWFAEIMPDWMADALGIDVKAARATLDRVQAIIEQNERIRRQQDEARAARDAESPEARNTYQFTVAIGGEVIDERIDAQLTAQGQDYQQTINRRVLI